MLQSNKIKRCTAFCRTIFLVLGLSLESYAVMRSWLRQAVISHPKRMTIKEARMIIAANRQQINQLLQDTNRMRAFIAAKNADPDPERTKRNRRNQRIYDQVRQGASVAALARQYGLTTEMIRKIVRRQAYRNKMATEK